MDSPEPLHAMQEFLLWATFFGSFFLGSDMGRLRDGSLARVLVGMDRSEVLEVFADFFEFLHFDPVDFWDVFDDLGAVFFVGEEVREC